MAELAIFGRNSSLVLKTHRYSHQNRRLRDFPANLAEYAQLLAILTATRVLTSPRAIFTSGLGGIRKNLANSTRKKAAESGSAKRQKYLTQAKMGEYFIFFHGTHTNFFFKKI